jgi:hypothetical protein
MREAGRADLLRSLRPRRWDAISAAVVLLLVLPEVHPRHGGLAEVALDVAFAIPLLWRSRWPFPVFLVIAGIAFLQWVAGVRVLGDVALLIALYTVASREDRRTALTAAAILEIGVILALGQWFHDAHVRSFIGLSGLVAAAGILGQNIGSCSRRSGSGPTASSSNAISRAGSRRRPSAPGSRGSCTTSSPITSR